MRPSRGQENDGARTPKMAIEAPYIANKDDEMKNFISFI